MYNDSDVSVEISHIGLSPIKLAALNLLGDDIRKLYIHFSFHVYHQLHEKAATSNRPRLPEVLQKFCSDTYKKTAAHPVKTLCEPPMQAFEVQTLAIHFRLVEYTVKQCHFRSISAKGL